MLFPPPFCLCLSPPLPPGHRICLPPVRFRHGGRGGGGPNGPIRGCWLMLHGPRSPTPAREREGGATAVAPFLPKCQKWDHGGHTPKPLWCPEGGGGEGRWHLRGFTPLRCSPPLRSHQTDWKAPLRGIASPPSPHRTSARCCAGSSGSNRAFRSLCKPTRGGDRWIDRLTDWRNVTLTPRITFLS